VSFLAGTQRILRAVVECPYRGAWWADVWTDGRLPGGPATLRFRGQAWAGTVVETRVDGDVGRARVVGGAGGLTAVTSSAWYRGAGLDPTEVARSILAPGGERLGGAVAGSVSEYQVFGASVARELDRLAAALGLRWYVSQAGAVEFDAADPLDYDLGIREETSTDAVRFGVEGGFIRYTPLALDGVTFLHARHELSKAGAYTTLRRGAAGALPVDVRALAPRAGTVDAQDGDRVDVTLDSGWAITGVPLYAGLPGMSVVGAQGSRVIVSYLDGDPRRPVAQLAAVDGPAPERVQIAGPTATTPVVKVGQRLIGTATGNVPGAVEIVILSSEDPITGDTSVLEVG